MKHVAVAALALHLVACSPDHPAADGGRGASGGTGGTPFGGTGGTASGGTAGTASGGSGGGTNVCGPGDQDCICPGGYFVCAQNRTTCVCPAQCTRSDQCGQGAFCFFDDGNCGRDRPGYCVSLAKASEWKCDDKPACGCDGNVYGNACAAEVTGVSTNFALMRDCTSAPLPCSTWPSTASCNPTWVCEISSAGGTSCGVRDGRCLSYNDGACDCETLPSGTIQLTCRY